MLLEKFKVKNILKGSLDLISSPSPSVKIQIMGGKVCIIWIFTEGEGDGIESRLHFKIFSTLRLEKDVIWWN